MRPSTPEPARSSSPGATEEAPTQMDSLVHELRVLLDELQWFLARDWQQIIRDPALAKALVR